VTEQKLTADRVREAAPEGWRQILGRLKARFSTGDLTSGLALVAAVGSAATAAEGQLEITLTEGDVVIALWTPAAHGITGRDLELAQRVSAVAARQGVAADPAGLTQLELGLDTTAAEHLAPFYAALLGAEIDRGELVDPSGQVPTVWWQDPTEHDQDLSLPPASVSQRWHFDVWVAHDEAGHRLQAVIDAGGRLISDAGAPAYWVVQDEEGNRSCICTPAGR